MKTKAAILWAPKENWSVEEIELDPPKGQEVLVRLTASGMCHSDEHLVTGDLPVALPLVGGHEGAGVIEAVGPAVTSVVPGDHVVLSFLPACGHCRPCSSGHQNLCDLGASLMTGRQVDGTARHHARGQDLGLMCMVGTFAHHTVCHEASVVKVEDDVPLDKACLIGCGVTTGWGASVYSAKVAPGDAVVVVGVGGVGTAAVQGAVLAGARFVVAVDPSEFKRESAMRFGATHAAASIQEAMGLVGDITWGRMAEKVILTAGVVHGDMIAPLMALVAKGGRAVVTGVTPVLEMDVTMNLADLTLSQKELVGSLFGAANPREDIPRLLDLYRAGKLQLDEMVTRTYPLDDVNQGYEDLRDNKNIRGVLLYD